MLDSLSKRECAAFREELSRRIGDEQLLRVLDVLVLPTSSPDSDILRKCGISHIEKHRALAQLYHRLLDFVSQGNPDQALSKQLQLARKLVADLNWEPAATVIQASLDLSHLVDNLAIFLDFYDLVHCFPDEQQPRLDHERFHEIAQQAEDIAVSRRLLFSAEWEKRTPATEARSQRLQRILTEAQARHSATIQNPRAMFFCLKAQCLCLALRAEYSTWIPLQDALVQHLQAHPSLLGDAEYILAREMATLARSYWVVKDRESFETASRRLLDAEFVSKLAQAEKIYWRYPFMLGVALESGDRARGEAECAELLDFLESTREATHRQGFVGRCLYTAAYFYLAAGDQERLTRTLGWMHRLDSNDTEPRYYLMAKFLAVLQDITLGFWVEAGDALKALRKHKIPIGLEGFEHITAFVYQWIRLKPFSGPPQEHAPIPAKLLEPMQSLEGKLILGYFDLFAWMEAQRRGMALLAIFRERDPANQ